MRRRKHLAITIGRHEQCLQRNLPVDPLKLEPPFQLPNYGPPIPERKSQMRGKNKHPTPQAAKEKRQATRRKARLWERLKMNVVVCFTYIPATQSRMAGPIECEPTCQAIAKTEKTDEGIAQSDKREQDVAATAPCPTDISGYKARINRALGPGKWHGSEYGKLLRQAVSQDATIQKVLPLVMAAATDIHVEEQERKEAAEAIIGFAITSMDDYNAVRASCEDQMDKLGHALAEIVLFSTGLDEGLSQRACEVYSCVTKINDLENELEAKREEMRELAKTRNRAIIAAAVGSLTAAPIIELFFAPGLVAKIWPFCLAYLATVGIIGRHFKAKVSLRNLSEQKELEASQEDAREALRDAAPLNLLEARHEEAGKS